MEDENIKFNLAKMMITMAADVKILRREQTKLMNDFENHLTDHKKYIRLALGACISALITSCGLIVSLIIALSK